MTNLNKWNRWYRGLEEAQPYADTRTYQIGADWLADCKVIEDWGCGKGWFSTFIGPEQVYVGVDGSITPFALKHVDLTDYQSKCDGLFMRHVLEHDPRWETILFNAVESFLHRMCLVLFTPLNDTMEDKQLAWNEDPGVPDLSLSKHRVEAIIALGGAEVCGPPQNLKTKAQYGEETVYLLEKR